MIYFIYFIQTLGELKSSVASYKSKKPRMVKKPKILIIGPIGSGKSSFITSVDKIFNGYGSQLAHVEEDSDGFSVTRQVGVKQYGVFAAGNVSNLSIFLTYPNRLCM